MSQTSSGEYSEHYTELDTMIRDLGREKDLPHGIHPDLVGPNSDNHYYWGRGQEERHKESVRWRRKLLAELKRRPKWVAAWRAERELNARIEELCLERGYRFRPWDDLPWLVDDDPSSDAPVQKLRRQLIAEIEGR